MSARNFVYPKMVVPLLLLILAFLPLLLYILPLLFFCALACLYAQLQDDVPVSNRNVRDFPSPRGPPCLLPIS